MRRLNSFLLLAIACGSPHQSSRHDGGGRPDGEIDGTTMMDAPPADSSVADAMPDAAADAMPDAALPVIPPEYECDVMQPGTVNVRTSGPNVTVLVHDVFGALVARTTSGPNSSVDITVPGCGGVTAAANGLYHTITYVRDGDVLWLDTLPGGASPLRGPGRLYIDTPVAGANSYRLVGPVSSSLVANDPTARDLFWTDRSVNAQGLTTFAVHPTDSVTGLPVPDTYHVFQDVLLASTMQSPLRLTSWSSQTWTLDLQLTFPQPTSVPLNSFAIWHETHQYFTQSGPSIPAGITHDFSIELPAYGSGLSIFLRYREAPAGNLKTHWQVIPIPQVPLQLDLSSQLPDILSTAIAQSSARPTVSWTLQPSSSSPPDLTVLRVQNPVEWRFALPPGLTSYRLPELPPDLALDLSNINVGVTLYESTDYSGYAAARGRFVETFIRGPALPMGLIFRATSYGTIAF